MKKTHTKIQKWYQQYGRKTLPWRTTTDPYAIYLSEVMLQQTQVKTVLERYYFPFLKRFPTLKELGKAPLDSVLKQWEGLGYYNRAKNLHKTASLIETLPQEIEALMQLPGIGKNTAHAIATFAFKQPVPIMEANVKRILCRLHKLSTPKEKKLWELAYQMVDKTDPFAYNQAMMDIGATLCTPKEPDCQQCPLQAICQGKEIPLLYPIKKKRIVPTRETTVTLFIYQDRVALAQRSGKFLHGLWGFETTQTPLCGSEYIGEVSHTYTHFKLHCKLWVYYETQATQRHYFSLEEIAQLAISKVDEKIIHQYMRTLTSNC